MASYQSVSKKQALRGLAIYFIVLVPLSALFEALLILGNDSWVPLLMWTPAFASFMARLVLREGIGDVSFRIGGGRGWKAIFFAIAFPVVIGTIAYGIGWTTGVIRFNPQPMRWAAPFLSDVTSPLIVMAVNIVMAATVVTIYGMFTAAGEEIGWRGYMLTRLIDGGVPRPVLVSGLIWGLWHVPLIMGGVYLAGPAPIVAASLWVTTATAFSFIFARLRLETGSVWPPIVLHAAWNSLIQVAFDPASEGSQVALWVGESGILVAITMVVAAMIAGCGKWRILNRPEEK